QWDAKASDGTEFPVVIYHVAATPCPVIPGQGNFLRCAREVRKAADLGGAFPGTKESHVKIANLGAEDRREPGPAPKAAPEKKSADKGDKDAEMSGPPEGPAAPSSVADQIKALLGLPPETNDETLVATIKQLCDDQGQDGGVPVG